MTTAVTADVLHQLVSTSHAEGITALGVQAVITRDNTFVLLVAEDGGDFIDDTWQLPGGAALPGQTLTDALYPAMAAIGLQVDDVTGYLGHDDEGSDPVMRTFRFTITVTDLDAICRSGRLAHWWADVDDVPGHGGGGTLRHTLGPPTGSASHLPMMVRSATIGEPSTPADGGDLSLPPVN
jgi:ADP-ribose pyrophosphatase YjhB (NUDIX family)